MLGGERISNTALGMRSADVETSAYSVEVKHKAKLPKWLNDAVSQAHRNCTAGRLPLVVLHQSGWRRENDLVVLRMGEFLEWFGEGKATVKDCLTVAKSDAVAGGAKEAKA